MSKKKKCYKTTFDSNVERSIAKGSIAQSLTFSAPFHFAVKPKRLVHPDYRSVRRPIGNRALEQICTRKSCSNSIQLAPISRGELITYLIRKGEEKLGDLIDAEAEAVNHAECMQRLYRATGEMRRTVAGKRKRELEDQVDTGSQGHLGTHPLVNQGRFTTLQEMAAHDRNRGIGTGNAQAFAQVVKVAVVEWIVFGNQPDSPHN